MDEEREESIAEVRDETCAEPCVSKINREPAAPAETSQRPDMSKAMADAPPEEESCSAEGGVWGATGEIEAPETKCVATLPSTAAVATSCPLRHAAMAAAGPPCGSSAFAALLVTRPLTPAHA